MAQTAETDVRENKNGIKLREKIKNLQRLVDRLEVIILPILEKDRYSRTTLLLLSNKGQIRKLDPRLKLIDVLYGIYRSLKNNPKLFIAQLKWFQPQIELYNNKKLSEAIEHMDVNEGEIPLLEELIGHLAHQPQQVIQHFLQEHRRYYEQRFAQAGDTDTVKHLMRLWVIISGEEMRYLHEYRNEIVKWPEWAKNVPLDYFNRHIRLYLEGGEEHLGREMRYMGLYTDFHDETIKEAVLKSNELRKIINHKKLVQFLEARFEEINVGLKEKWQGFYSFWDNIKPNAKHLEELGYANIKNWMLKGKAKYSESPLVWEKEIRKIHDKINSTPYITEKVIKPASDFLKRLFENRMDELAKLKGEATADFQKFLRDKKAEILQSPQKFANELIKLIVRWDKAVGKEWTEKRRIFEEKEKIARRESAKMIIELEEVYKQLIPLRFALDIKRIIDNKVEWTHYFNELIKLVDPSNPTGLAFQSLAKAKTAPLVLEQLNEELKDKHAQIKKIDVKKLDKQVGKMVTQSEHIDGLMTELMAYIEKMGVMEWIEQNLATSEKPEDKSGKEGKPVGIKLAA